VKTHIKVSGTTCLRLLCREIFSKNNNHVFAVCFSKLYLNIRHSVYLSIRQFCLAAILCCLFICSHIFLFFVFAYVSSSYCAHLILILSFFVFFPLVFTFHILFSRVVFLFFIILCLLLFYLHSYSVLLCVYCVYLCLLHLYILSSLSSFIGSKKIFIIIISIHRFCSPGDLAHTSFGSELSHRTGSLAGVEAPPPGCERLPLPKPQNLTSNLERTGCQT
jgi:hypothetical protein